MMQMQNTLDKSVFEMDGRFKSKFYLWVAATNLKFN